MATDSFSKYGNHTRINHSLVAPPNSKQRERYSGPNLQRNYGFTLKPAAEWRDNSHLWIKVRGILSVDLDTYTVKKAFGLEGQITFVEVFGSDGNAKVKFTPPPHKAFWEILQGKYPFQGSKGRYFVSVELAAQRKGRDQVPSPTRRGVYYDAVIKLLAGRIQFGIMTEPTRFLELYVAQPIKNRPQDITFEVDLRRLRINASFNVLFERGRALDRVNRLMIQIPFAAMKKIQRKDFPETGTFGLLVSLDSPPQIYRKSEEDRAGHKEESLIWTEFEAWFRQTDIVYDVRDLQTKIVSLHKKEAPIIDVGRWKTYLFQFVTSSIPEARFNEMKQALQDFNIEIETMDVLKKQTGHLADIWSWIDRPLSQNASSDLSIKSITLPFEIRYQLEVCISHEFLNEYNISAAFIERLALLSSEDPLRARNMLEWVADKKNAKRIWDPMSLFSNDDAMNASFATAIPHYCGIARKATITPTAIYFGCPAVETTNRVLRHYARENAEGRFLRVQFTDEREEGRINACAEKTRNDELFSRVFRTLYNGIQIGDRHYQFLAFGNSQFRENGAYFFCPTDHLSCDDIRQWMGNFSAIKVVAKYAARLGQCFSTTRAINGLSKPDLVRIPDVVLEVGEKKYNFTDGVGKISAFLAQMIAAELGVRSNVAPSAFQFRLGGAKGILVVWPEAKEREVHLRESQAKFPAVYNGLEIIRCARFSTANLNRQTITILSALGVPDQVFIDMLVEQLANYQNAMSDNELAMHLLLTYIDENAMTINIATMIRNGFMAERDPFVLSLLHLWRSWSIKLLKEKAKIIVEGGAFVLGCVDETNTLRGYKTPSVARGQQNLVEELPEIFIQVPDKTDPNRYNVVEGICLVGRNPSLHPGDIRVVRAVDVPALHHLRDVVVFPLNGERDIPSMCSGGDLDGDDFFVIWDENLLPREWNCDPMDYDGPKARNLHRPVQITDLMKFFVRFMKNDTLPTIAHAHLALSDYMDMGVKDPKCLELTELHSKAVDYVKTGEPAVMPKRLNPTKWPHFMEKKHKPKEAQYVSGKILGQLYDKVERVNFTPKYEEPFDKRILRAYKLENSLLKMARQVKTQYDTAMRRLMAQQEIATEFEIWTTYVLSKPRIGSDYKLQEEIGRLSDSLKEQFRNICILKAGGDTFEVLGPFVAGMYKVTKEEMDIALAECRTMRMVGGREVPKRKMEPRFMPLMSFPWLFEKELGRIATGIEFHDDVQDSNAPQTGKSRKRNAGGAGKVDLAEDFIQQEDGIIVHRGEELDLFRHVDDSDDESDFIDDEARLNQEEHDFIRGEDGELVLATAFPAQNNSTSADLLVDEVVPRIRVDGLINSHEAAQLKAARSQQPKGYNQHQIRRSSGSDSTVLVNSINYPASVSLLEQDTVHVSHPFSGSTNARNAESKAIGDSTKLDSKYLAPDQLFRDANTSSVISAYDDGEHEVEEEEVDLEIKESALEKLARMIGTEDGTSNLELVIEAEPSAKIVQQVSDQSIGQQRSQLAGAHNDATELMGEIEIEIEEEVIDLEVKESSLERLARLMDS